MARAALSDRLADRLRDYRPDAVLRVAVDGPPAAGGGELARELADRLLAAGRPAVLIPADGFLRPASLRLEHGRQDPDAYYEDTLDVGALRREVLAPLGPGGNGHYLPSLWDPVTDRATRAARQPVPAAAAVLVEGVFLLRPELAGDFDVSVHLRLSPAARRRRVVAARELPAYDRYDAEVAPVARADLVVLWDDPARPALVDRLG